MKVLLISWLALLFSVLIGTSRCSSSISSTTNPVSYEGRFSKIERVHGFEPIDAVESMSKYNLTVQNEGGRRVFCDLICQLKAASVLVVVPVADGKCTCPFDTYHLKIKLLKDLSMLPVESFTENEQVLASTIEMIESHLFYRIYEYDRYIREIVSKFPAMYSYEHHLNDIVENSWGTILKPVYVILGKLVKSSNYDKGHHVHLDDLIPTLVQLISSPIEEESSIASELVKYSLFSNTNDHLSVSVAAIINNLEFILMNSIKGNSPLLFIDPILKFVGDLMFPCYRRGSEHFISSKLLSLVRNKLLSLPLHNEFAWIYDSFKHLAVQYFTFFEVSPGKTIERSPFEPVFPVDSPFEESEQVILMRQVLLTQAPTVAVDGEHVENSLNHFARLAVLHELSLYQFYPRSMIPEIFKLILSTFMKFQNIDSAIHLYSLILKSEIYEQNDEISKIIKNDLHLVSEILKNNERFSPEMRNLCSSIENQIEIINQFSSE